MKQPKITNLERSIGKKHATLLQGAIRAAIHQESKSFSTLALKTKVVSKMKNGQLQRLVLNTPKHSFIQHHGFNGVRSNGRKLALKETNHLMSFRSLGVLNSLATEISEARAEKVIAQINF